MLAVGKHGIYPAENADGGFAEQWIARDGIAVQIVSQQLGIVVGHLLEMGHQPALIDRISMETAAELIVNAAAGHFFEQIGRASCRERVLMAVASVHQKKESEQLTLELLAALIDYALM